MSGYELFSWDSESEAFSPVISDQGPQTSSGSDTKSEEEGSGRGQSMSLADKLAKTLSSKGIASRLGQKRTVEQPKSSKHVCMEKRHSKDGTSSLLRSKQRGDTRDSSTIIESGAEVKSALKEITSLLNTVVERVERMEGELQRQKSTGPSSSSDTTPTRAKPPLAVKSEVRRVYRELLESDDCTFAGFNLESGSLSQENRLKLTGKHIERKQARRRRERLLRKLQERRATLTKSAMAQKEKDKWAKVLVAEMMSSEESDLENEDTMTVKPLPWRAEKVSAFLHRLDKKVQTVKSSQAKRQRKRRVESTECSLHSKPVHNIHDWAIVN